MSMQIFNSIVANLRQQFPTLSEAIILQKASEIYQSQLGALNEAAKTQIKIEQERLRRSQQHRELKNTAVTPKGRGLFSGLLDLWRKP